MTGIRIRYCLQLVLTVCTTFMVGVAGTPAWAQDWPTKPVKIIVPFAAGGFTDVLTRLVANKLTLAYKQPFVVENQPGASGIIGSDRVAKAAPDGYILLASGMASLVIAPSAGPAPFDPLKSFTHIALFGGPPQCAGRSPKFAGKGFEGIHSLC